MPSAGEIWLDRCYYKDDHGEWHQKYAVILAVTSAKDIVHRVLTSRGNGRPHAPACFHGDPYPSYFLGILGGGLSKESWLDLQHADDYDGLNFANAAANGALKLVATIPSDLLCPALACAANAPDTTKAQWRAISDQRQLLGCPAA